MANHRKYNFEALKINDFEEYKPNSLKNYRRINQAAYRARKENRKLNIAVKVIGDTIRVTRYKNLNR